MKTILILKFAQHDQFKLVRDHVETLPTAVCNYNGGQKAGEHHLIFYYPTSASVVWNVAMFCSQQNIKPIVEVPTLKPTAA